jgi:hypothetical protein
LGAGVSVSRLKRALVALRRHYPDISPDSLLPASHLLTDGKEIYLQTSEEVVEHLRSGQTVFAFVVELNRVRAEVVVT